MEQTLSKVTVVASQNAQEAVDDIIRLKNRQARMEEKVFNVLEFVNNFEEGFMGSPTLPIITADSFVPFFSHPF